LETPLCIKFPLFYHPDSPRSIVFCAFCLFRENILPPYGHILQIYSSFQCILFIILCISPLYYIIYKKFS
jgi:hypothetical protein